MATKPTNLAEWATGAAPIVEPSLPQKQAGWVPAFKPPAQWFNWWWNLVHLWIVWLDAFESEAHTWTASQTFTARTFVTGSPGAFPLLNVTHSGLGPALSASASTGTAIVGSSVGGGVSGVAPVGSTSTGYGVRGFTDSAAAPAIRGVTNVASSTIVDLVGGALSGVTMLFGSSTGVGSRGIDLGSVDWGGRFTATGAAGRGVIGIGPFAGLEGLGSANGDGVRGVGSGSGVGGRFTGANVEALVAIATSGNNAGAVAIGAGTGAGLTGVGGAGGGVGGSFSRGDSALNAPAVGVLGAIDFGFAVPPAGGANVARQFHSKHAPRAWASVTLNGTASPAFNDRIGVASVSQDAAGVVTVTLAQPMASINWALEAVWHGNTSSARIARGVATSATTATVVLFDPAAPSVVLLRAATIGEQLLVKAWGDQ